MTAADTYALTWLLTLGYAAQLARVADLEDQLAAARARVEEQQVAHESYRLLNPQPRHVRPGWPPIPLTDTPKD